MAGAGAGMLKLPEVTCVNGVEVKSIVTPLTAPDAPAVRPAKVATPEEADTVSVPPKVQVPCTAAAVMLAELVVTVLPY